MTGLVLLVLGYAAAMRRLRRSPQYAPAVAVDPDDLVQTPERVLAWAQDEIARQCPGAGYDVALRLWLQIDDPDPLRGHVLTAIQDPGEGPEAAVRAAVKQGLETLHDMTECDANQAPA